MTEDPRPYEELEAIARGQRPGRLTDDEHARTGGWAGGAAVAALILGILGLGPLGLVPGVLAVRRGGPASWIGAVGLLLCSVSTAVILGALLAALLTG